MPDNAWIETVSESDADGPLAELYDRIRDKKTGRVDHILKIHSLNPQSLADHLSLYRNVMHAKCGLSRAEREMVAVVVSDINACHY